MSENNTDLNEVFEEEMDDADVITVPIDETLSNSGEAADAAAVGAALALKADKDELPATIKVNNQPADNQGLILIDGTDIPVSDSNTKTLAEAIEEASEMTAATIHMTGEAGAATIGETIGVLQETVEGIAGNMSADKIPMSEAEDAETIAEAIGIIEDNVEELAETVEGMEQKTADKVLMETGSTVTVKDAIETLDRTAVKSVNRKLPDASGDVDLSVVPLAENLQSDKLQSIEGEFTLRTTGGTGSVSDGKAYPQHIYGNSRHDGFVAEVLNLTVIPIARTEPDEPITATIDRDTFLEEVEDSDTINLYYTTEWSEDPADYGVTVTGDPVAGDQITIVYVKEVRGTIVVAEPERLVGTGWNLFNYNAGYARVVKYSEAYGYKIGGTFTSIAFAASLTDDRISLLPNIDGLFSVPGDGYVFVTGGNNTDTYILTTWSDWIEGPSTGYWEAYRESGIDLSAVVETYFPYGMLKVGTVRDEIDLVAKRTISRIERMVYNEENRATAAATGRAYDFDENNIYVVRAEPVLNAITIDSEYSVSEHGLEWFTETELPLDTEILYGKNLRDKLERNVLTISAQTLTEEEKSQVRTNIGAMSQAEGDTKLVAPTEAGTAGQLLHLKEDGGTEWTTQGTPTDAQVGTAVSAWLDAHPEATTTVEDGAISRAKLNDDLKAKTDAVPDLKSAFIQNYAKVQAVEQNANFNSDTYKVPGNYSVATGAIASTVTNIPEQTAGMLSVIQYNGTVFGHIYLTYTGFVYRRRFTANAWGSWVRDTNLNDLVPFDNLTRDVNLQTGLIVSNWVAGYAFPSDGKFYPTNSKGVHTDFIQVSPGEVLSCTKTALGSSVVVHALFYTTASVSSYIHSIEITNLNQFKVPNTANYCVIGLYNTEASISVNDADIVVWNGGSDYYNAIFSDVNQFIRANISAEMNSYTAHGYVSVGAKNRGFTIPLFLVNGGKIKFKITNEENFPTGITFNGYQIRDASGTVKITTTAKEWEMNSFDSDSFSFAAYFGSNLESQYSYDVEITVISKTVSDMEPVPIVRIGTHTERYTNFQNYYIYGENETGSIISDNSGTYETPPIEISGGVISNVTVKETGGDTGHNAYCVHTDNNANIDNTLIIQNCTFESNSAHCIGVGTREGYKLKFINCIFKQTNPNSDCVYIHNTTMPEAPSSSSPAEIEFIGCTFVSDGAELLKLQDWSSNTDYCIFTFINNVFSSSTGVIADMVDIQYRGYDGQQEYKSQEFKHRFSLSHNSIGNTVPFLNYQAT